MPNGLVKKRMEIIPAIDLRGGKCVRLYQGDYSQETVFSADPVGMARHWQSLGALRLHIVDLDGAAKGEVCHAAVVAEIARYVDIPLQFGGGIRGLDAVELVLDLGVERAILGTAAVEDTAFVAEACCRFKERIIVAIDAREGLVATRGWREKTGLTAGELLQQMVDLGVRRFIYTDISRDGTLSGPHFAAVAELVKKTALPIIAAGGISSVDHIKRLNQLGIEGVIVGRALYTGALDLKEALRCIPP